MPTHPVQGCPSGDFSKRPSASVTKETIVCTKGKVLIVGSSSDTFDLKSGLTEPTGYYLNELAIPARAIVDNGFEVVLTTPNGALPAVEKFSISADYFGGSGAQLQMALDFVATSPGLQAPRTISSVVEEGLDGYAGVFLPGGHPPMIDLMQDPGLGAVLRHFHAESKPTALLCHGPIALTAAMPKAREFRTALVQSEVDAAER